MRRLGRPIATGLALALLGSASGARSQPTPELPGAAPHPPELAARLAAAVASRPAGWHPRTRHLNPDGSPRYTNRLALETSPYLLQHAHNPVDWRSWGEDAFETARRLDRPLFVSIGYSTCHWCHVMEEESFDDEEIARLLNAHFVPVKVDREVRPDVDAIYMSALQSLGEQGGWPLNVWLTPQGKPFFGGTYFPREDSHGRPGFERLLTSLRDVWSGQRERVNRQAESLAAAVSASLASAPVESPRMPPESLLRTVLASYRRGYDPEWGGLRGRQKFPASLPVRLLLRIERRTGEESARQMALLTLERMAAGGLRDQLGGGFHRYSTDPEWRVPHFEKMLYDNALLALAYLEAWQATGREEFAEVVRETLAYLERDLGDPAGGFYSATDADSPAPDGGSEEGRYFTWTPAELSRALGEDAALAADAFGVVDDGPVEGRSVLYRARDEAELAARHGLAPEQVRARLARVRERLLAVRAERPPPHRDEKVLVAWNGLAISAYARAGFAFGDPALVARAERAADFLLTGLRSGARLQRMWQAGSAGGPAFLDDYAGLIAGLLDLYEAAPAPRWIAEARALQAVLDAHYADAEHGGYFRTADDQPELLAREKPVADGALPSGNSLCAANLLRLAAFTGDDGYRDRAEAVFAAFHDRLLAEPTRSSELLIALDFALEPGKEVLIVGAEGAPDLDPLLAALRRTYLPNRIVAAVREGPELTANAEQVPLLRHKQARDGQVTAYVCVERVCRFPTRELGTFREQLLEVRPIPEE